MLFYFKYNSCFNRCTWKELGYAVNSNVVHGRLPAFAAENKRGTMQTIRERGKIHSLLKKQCHLETWFSLSICQKDPFWYQTVFPDQVIWEGFVIHCIFLVFHTSGTSGYSAAAMGCWSGYVAVRRSAPGCGWRCLGLILYSVIQGLSASEKAISIRRHFQQAYMYFLSCVTGIIRPSKLTEKLKR